MAVMRFNLLAPRFNVWDHPSLIFSHDRLRRMATQTCVENAEDRRIAAELAAQEVVRRADERNRVVGLVYFVEAEGTGFIKIGWSKASPDNRRDDLQIGCPFKLRILATMEGTRTLEWKMHRRFREHRATGGKEWFRRNEELDELIALLQQAAPT